MFLLTLPLTALLGYCWTVAILQAELASGDQNAVSLGQMIILAVIPLTIMFMSFYIYLIMGAIGYGLTKSLKVKLFALGMLQTFGTVWGWLILGRQIDASSWPLLCGSICGLAFSLILLWLFPKEQSNVSVILKEEREKKLA